MSPRNGSRFTTRRSTRSAGSRALGARRTDIVRLVVGQSLSVTLAGIAAGLVAALALTRYIATLLYGVAPHDTVTYVAVPAILLAVSLVACISPARRAAAADPVTLLRSQ